VTGADSLRSAVATLSQLTLAPQCHANDMYSRHPAASEGILSTVRDLPLTIHKQYRRKMKRQAPTARDGATGSGSPSQLATGTTVASTPSRRRQAPAVPYYSSSSSSSSLHWQVQLEVATGTGMDPPGLASDLTGFKFVKFVLILLLLVLVVLLL